MRKNTTLTATLTDIETDGSLDVRTVSGDVTLQIAERLVLQVVAQAFSLREAPGQPLLKSVSTTLVLAMAASGTLAVAIERLAYRPLRHAPRLNVLITAIGVSLFLENTGQLRWLFGTQPQPMPRLVIDQPLFRFANVNINVVDVMVVGGGTAGCVVAARLAERTGRREVDW